MQVFQSSKMGFKVAIATGHDITCLHRDPLASDSRLLTP